MKVVIIGGDAAGMSAASKLKRMRPEWAVVVLEKTYDVSYSACGMPYNIADPKRPIEDLVVRDASTFRKKQQIELRTGHNVERIDPSEKKVFGQKAEGGGFEESYDRLVIATGGSAIAPASPGFDLEGVMVLKSLDDGRKLKAYLASHKVEKAVIVGMGYIGLEMCEALATRGVQVSMVKSNPGLLPWMDEILAKEVASQLSTHGVSLYAGYPVREILEKEGKLALRCDTLTLEADLILAAIGVRPNSGIAKDAGLQLGAGSAISVDRFLRTSDPDIYAAGDCADSYHVVTGKKAWIPLALRANRSGWAVADNLCGITMAIPPVAGTAVFKVFDLEVARTGITEKEALKEGFDPVSVVIESRSRAHSHPGAASIWVQMTGDRTSGRLIGAQMVGKEGCAHRINAAAVALHAQMSVQAFSESDLAYAPPFGPVWDPLLTAANQLLKKMNR